MQTRRNLIVSKLLLKQVLHLLHEVGICVVFRLLLLWRRSHLTSTWLGSCLEYQGYLAYSFDNPGNYFLQTGSSPVVEQGQSCTEELLAFWVSALLLLLLLLLRHRLSLLSGWLGQTWRQKVLYSLIKSIPRVNKEVKK